ncbi:hypothetical protein SK128_026220 [Halocaridina rubra]|uniref:HTH psq-type domain-containing protein n=1 Tax=Halocaridina rubra TaxID=373956 RepID=A0AAN8XG50_HALRR
MARRLGAMNSSLPTSKTTKRLTQVGLPDSWVNNADSSQTGNAGAAQFGSKEDFAHCQQDAQNYADMEEAMDHSHLGYTKREPTLDLMSMCEDVDIGGGTSPNKSNIGGKEDNLVRRVQIKVESGVDLPIIDRDQPASCNLQQDDPHTATHYISAGEEVVVHHEASDLQHSHSGDGIIQGDPLAEAITVTQKGTDLGAHTITKSITEATPVMDVGSVQQTATATRTIDEGLIILGLGSETHTTIISAGPSTPIKTTTKTVRPSMQYKARKYTKQDMQTAVKLVQEGHMGLKPAAKAFSIPATTLLRTTKRKEFQSTPDGKK